MLDQPLLQSAHFSARYDDVTLRLLCMKRDTCTAEARAAGLNNLINDIWQFGLGGSSNELARPGSANSELRTTAGRPRLRSGHPSGSTGAERSRRPGLGFRVLPLARRCPRWTRSSGGDAPCPIRAMQPRLARVAVRAHRPAVGTTL